MNYPAFPICCVFLFRSIGQAEAPAPCLSLVACSARFACASLCVHESLLHWTGSLVVPHHSRIQCWQAAYRCFLGRVDAFHMFAAPSACIRACTLAGWRACAAPLQSPVAGGASWVSAHEALVAAVSQWQQTCCCSCGIMGEPSFLDPCGCCVPVAADMLLLLMGEPPFWIHPAMTLSRGRVPCPALQ